MAKYGTAVYGIAYYGEQVALYPLEVDPDDAERLLPAWMLVSSYDDSIRTSSLHWNTVSGLLAPVVCLHSDLKILAANCWLPDNSLPIQSYIWGCSIGELVDISTVTVMVSSDTEATVLRRATSEFDFFSSRDAVFVVSPDHMVYMRNIDTTVDAVATNSDGVAALPSNMSHDSRILVASSEDYSSWTLLAEVYINRDSYTAVMPTTGEYLIDYVSDTRVDELSAPSIYIDTLPPKPATKYFTWNRFDEEALSVGEHRLTDETNFDLRDRIRAAYCLVDTIGKDSVTAKVGQGVGLVGIMEWDGISTVDFAASGLTEITSVVVRGIPRQELVSGDELYHDSTNEVFISSKAQWDSGYLIYIDGMQVSPTSVSATVASGRVEFDDAQSGRVVATYGVTNYEITITGGYVTSIAPTNNMVPGNYRLLYVYKLQSYPVSDVDYQESQLLTSSGEANEKLQQLKRVIQSHIPITLGTVEWSEHDYWFDGNEPVPTLSSLPLILN